MVQWGQRSTAQWGQKPVGRGQLHLEARSRVQLHGPRTGSLLARSSPLAGPLSLNARRENRGKPDHLERLFVFATMGARQCGMGDFCQTNPFSAPPSRRHKKPAPRLWGFPPRRRTGKPSATRETPTAQRGQQAAGRWASRVALADAINPTYSSGTRLERSDRPTEGCPEGGRGDGQQPSRRLPEGARRRSRAIRPNSTFEYPRPKRL